MFGFPLDLSAVDAVVVWAEAVARELNHLVLSVEPRNALHQVGSWVVFKVSRDIPNPQTLSGVVQQMVKGVWLFFHVLDVVGGLEEAASLRESTH